MLTSISWQQYMLALGVLITGYYSVIILLYFRVEFFSILNRIKNGKPIHKSHSVQKEVLGAIVKDQNESSLTAEELEFPSRESNQLIEENH